MQPIRKVVTTSLYWETLGALRGTPRYDKLREQIADLVRRKSDNRGPVNGRDQMFNAKGIPALYGLWHCSISRNPDVVLFYAMEGDTITLGMLGDHNDYPTGSTKNPARYQGVGTRIRNAIAAGHVSTPNWTDIKWSRPADLVANPEVEELSVSALYELLEVLERETHDAPIFERVHGKDIMETDGDSMDAWLDEVSKAHSHVATLMRKPKYSPEETAGFAFGV